MSAESKSVEPVNPFAAFSNAKKMMTLIGLFLAVFGSLMQSTSQSTLLPIAATELGGLDYYTLASTLGGVVGILVMPLWGYLGARAPHLKPILLSGSIFAGAVGLVMRAFAFNMVLLIGSAMLWSFVSAGIYVIGYSLIRDMYDAKKAGTYLGLCGSIMMFGSLIGPVFCGAIMDVFGWRVVCHIIWVIMAIGGVVALLGVRVTKEQTAHMVHAGGSFDTSGTLAVVVFLGCFVVALSTGTNYIPFGSTLSWALFGIAIVGLVWLVLVIRKKGADAIIPGPAFKDRNTVCFTVANFCLSLSNMAIFFFISLYILNVMGLSATQAGGATTAMSIVGLFLSPVLGRIIGKSGTARGVVVVCTLVRIACAAALLFFLTPTSSIWLVYIILFFAGIYNCSTSSIFGAGPQIQLPASIRVQGNSLIQMGQNLGSTIGIAVYTAIIGIFGMVEGFSVALIVSIVFAVIGLIAGAMLRKLED